ncbi:16619_t:CDS:2, partial [Gigaspora margarita]
DVPPAHKFSENEKVSTVEKSDWKLLCGNFHKTLIDLTEKELLVIKNELESATNNKESAETNAKENKNKNQHLDKKVPYSQGRKKNKLQDLKTLPKDIS